MDIEEQFRAYPLIATAFMMSCLLSISLIFAFVMQWNQFSMTEKSYDGFKKERKEKGTLKSGLKWYFLGDFLSVWKIWKESKGLRFIFPLGVAFGLVAWALFRYLQSLPAST